MREKRYALVDGIRGLAVVNMVLFHFLYDVYMICGKNPNWYSMTGNRIWQQAICWTFIFVAGFVWRLGSRHNLRRGLFFNGCGLAISLITWLVIPSEAVRFGILSFMGCAVLLLIPLHRLLGKCPPGAGLLVSLAAFGLTKHIQQGYLGFLGKVLLDMPECLYQVKLLTPLGFPWPEFRSSDYFPVFPWLFLFLAGYFFYGIFKKRAAWQELAKIRLPLLSAVGQRSIWIYLAHQPVCMALAVLLT